MISNPVLLTASGIFIGLSAAAKGNSLAVFYVMTALLLLAIVAAGDILNNRR